MYGVKAGPGDGVSSVATEPGSSPLGSVGGEKEGTVSIRGAYCSAVCSLDLDLRWLDPRSRPGHAHPTSGPRPGVRAAPASRGPATNWAA